MSAALEIEVRTLRNRVRQLEQTAREVVPPAPSSSVMRIICAAAREFDVPVAGILSVRRTAALAEARQVAMTLSLDLLQLSLPRVGRAFGRDHTTVLHAQRLIHSRIEGDAGFAARVARVRQAATTKQGASA